jgi:5-methylcytosine-specific restriction endonuclease McrA
MTAFRPESHPKVKRAKLEARAPGLSNRRRLALLKKWRRKGAICIYCGISPADTVDHVVPLVLGGTNFEGNLAPCCRKCNSSKAGLTVSEWRHDVRVKRHALSMPHG